MNKVLTKAKVPKRLFDVEPVYYSKALVVSVDYEAKDVAWVFNVYSTEDVTGHECELHSGLMEAVVK